MKRGPIKGVIENEKGKKEKGWMQCWTLPERSKEENKRWRGELTSYACLTGGHCGGLSSCLYSTLAICKKEEIPGEKNVTLILDAIEKRKNIVQTCIETW